ncbi:hypothetical protein RN001_003937 [Aquatica leii]|uniref:LisH domain-containing protein n=1 Tax=Aquatica leii TaxID=1421715 RepID=A0AAN7PPG5_9COLE|nr:hypothetical protein RN001_003937 [Aquatica leii]
MTEKNITPAINLHNDMPNELSSEEFQKYLYGWFQDRGLLTELRAHLRKQMVNVLKDSAMGHTVATQQKQSLSPKVQGINLLIGEFLLYHNYYYSLSVFSTEVPAISVLPEFPLGVNNEWKTKKWRFMEKDMWDLLETLGIARESDFGEKVYQSYYKTDTEPLLTSIINCIKLTNKGLPPNRSCENLFECSTYEEWIKTVGELLQFNNISTPNIKDILNTIVNLVETERKRIKKEAVDDLLQHRIKLEEEFTKRYEEQKKKLKLVTNSLEMEKTKVLNEQTRKQKEVDQFSVKVLKHQNLLQDRYHTLIVRERDVNKKEYNLKQKEECLQTQQQRLQNGFDALYQEQKALADLQKKVQQELNEHRGKFNVAFFDDIQKVMNGDQESKESENVELSAEDKEEMCQKELIVQLQVENKALQNINLEQRARIDELTERSSLLLRDLESTQAAVNILSTNNSSVLTAPPLLPPTSYTFDRNSARSVRSGGGEDGSRVISPTTSREFRNLGNWREVKRRLPPRRVSGFSSSTSDEGTTNKILQEARDKLRRLEEESEEVDRHYQRFKLKRAQDSFTFSPCFNDIGNAQWLSNLNKDKFGTSSVMEYIPQHEFTIRKDGSRSPASNLDEAGPSNVQSNKNKKTTDAVCKDSEVTSISSGLDLGTSGVSLSHVDSSEEKTTS